MVRAPRLQAVLPSKPTVVKVATLTGLAAMLATLTLVIGETVKHEFTTALPSAVAQSPTSPSSTRSNAAGESTPRSGTPYHSDGRGFINSSARCPGSQVAAALGRTAQSLFVICSYNGEYEYRGVRLSDGATLNVAAEPTSADAFVARNDGVTYSVSPAELVVASGRTVLRSEPMIDYHQPGSFSGSQSYSESETYPDTGSYPAEAGSTTPTTSAPATG